MSDLISHPVSAVIIFIGLLVFIHELGHFLVGKLSGIGVEMFSIGFGPKIIGFTRNGTDYRIALIPLGGFVKFAGAIQSEDVPERFKGMEMYRASLWARGLTVLAGPFANLLLAVSIYTFLGSQGIKHPPAVIGQVIAGGAADQAGLLAGDRVLSVQGESIDKWAELRDKILESPKKLVNLVVERGGSQHSFELTPESKMLPNNIGTTVEQGRAGITYGFLSSVITVDQNLNRSSGGQNLKLETGDELVEVSFEGASGTQQFSIDGYWYKLQEAVWGAYIVKARQLTLAVAQGGAGPEHNENPSVRQVSVSLDSWYTDESFVEETSFNPTFSDQLLKKIAIMDSQLTVSEVLADSSIKLKAFDQILSINGKDFDHIFQLGEFLKSNKEAVVQARVRRGSEVLNLDLALKPVERQEIAGKVTYFSLPVKFGSQAKNPEPFVERYDSFLGAFAFGVQKTTYYSGMIVSMIWGLLKGEVPIKALGGPILIARVAGQAVELGLEAFLTSLALISINLGMINLFPIPALDGGQFLLILAEGLKGKPLSEVAIENFQRIGFVMIMCLVVLATYNDLSRFWGAMLKGLVGIFE